MNLKEYQSEMRGLSVNLSRLGLLRGEFEGFPHKTVKSAGPN